MITIARGNFDLEWFFHSRALYGNYGSKFITLLF